MGGSSGDGLEREEAAPYKVRGNRGRQKERKGREKTELG
jgi:hypothetical protein